MYYDELFCSFYRVDTFSKVGINTGDFVCDSTPLHGTHRDIVIRRLADVNLFLDVNGFVVANPNDRFVQPEGVG